jgi:hypothetical protein
MVESLGDFYVTGKMLWKWLSCLILWELDADEKMFHQTPNPNPDPGPDPHAIIRSAAKSFILGWR